MRGHFSLHYVFNDAFLHDNNGLQFPLGEDQRNWCWRRKFLTCLGVLMQFLSGILEELVTVLLLSWKRETKYRRNRTMKCLELFCLDGIRIRNVFIFSF